MKIGKKMGRLLKRKIIKKVEHYKFWSTITDSYINDEWLNKEEAIKFLFWERFRKLVDGVLEDGLIFPDGYFDKDTKAIIRNKNKDKYFDLQMKMIKNNELYYSEFYKIMQSIGLKMKITDGEVGINTNSKPKPMVNWEGQDYFDIIKFDGINIDLKTTPDGGTYFSSMSISDLKYREKNNTKAKAKITEEGDYTIFNLYDDYGYCSIMKIHNSLENHINIAKNNLINQKLLV